MFEGLEGNGLLRRLDPRVRVILALGFAAVMATARRPEGLALAFPFVAALWALAGVSSRLMARRLSPPLVVVLLLAISLAIFQPGHALFRIGPFGLSREGLLQALLLLARCGLILTATALLLSTSSLFEVVHGLRQLGLPEKLAGLLFFTFRYAHVVGREHQRMSSSLRLRCFRPRTSSLTYRTYAWLVGNLLVRSYDRSHRVSQAMRCRGLRGSFPALRPLSLRPPDRVALCAGGLYLAALALASWAG